MASRLHAHHRQITRVPGKGAGGTGCGGAKHLGEDCHVDPPIFHLYWEIHLHRSFHKWRIPIAGWFIMGNAIQTSVCHRMSIWLKLVEYL